MVKCTCAMCGKQYDTGEIVLEKELNPITGLERIFYEAPCCGFEYTIAITDKEVRGLMNRKMLLMQIYRKSPTERTRKKLDKLTKEIKRKMDALNKVSDKKE